VWTLRESLLPRKDGETPGNKKYYTKGSFTMKNFKRIAAIVLAVAMIFALSASAFATGHSVTVSVYWEDVLDYSIDVDASDIETLCDNNAHLYTVTYPNNVTYPTTYTAADALLASYLKNYEQSSFTSDEIDYAWYQTNYPNSPAHYGLYISRFEGLEYDAVGTYYLVEGLHYSEELQDYAYTYYWVGDGWSLNIDGTLAEYYPSEYTFDEISSITFTYMPIRSDNFESTTYIPGALPAPNN
jgi:hypothetical protein